MIWNERGRTISQVIQAIILYFKLQRVGHFARVVQDVHTRDIDGRHFVILREVKHLRYSYVSNEACFKEKPAQSSLLGTRHESMNDLLVMTVAKNATEQKRKPGRVHLLRYCKRFYIVFIMYFKLLYNILTRGVALGSFFPREKFKTLSMVVVVVVAVFVVACSPTTTTSSGEIPAAFESFAHPNGRNCFAFMIIRHPRMQVGRRMDPNPKDIFQGCLFKKWFHL